MGRRAAREAADLHIAGPWRIQASHGYLIQGKIERDELLRAGEALLADPVTEVIEVRACGIGAAARPSASQSRVVHVMPKPGVTDAVGESALAILRDQEYAVDHVRTTRSFEVEGPASGFDSLLRRVLSNDAVEMAVDDPIRFDTLDLGSPYRFERVDVAIRDADDDALARISRAGQLSLSLSEMRSIQAHFRELGREPSDCELETIAQTWSEHCSHKTLKGRVEYGGKTYENILKQTIFKATKELNCDWLVSVFEDNAGIVRFDDEHDVCIKVETHNRPSAIDPYGGANTGLGGVIRDVLGTGLGGKPIANTDVFCVGPLDTPPESLPPGVLPPRRVLEGVVAGVRDYGNRMGIPTVNGAVCVHPGYLANPLVFCGTIGVMPRGMSHKSVEPGDRIVAIGGRTGRDGIHGATFSSVELTSDSANISGGAVQIGNAITEKMVLDVVLQARDRRLFRAITDCGAGGFSSAVGEMGANLGASVDLEKAPLKYEGLSYTEIWISEAQERMVLAVPPENLAELKALCASEGVEATDLGEFVDTGRLTLRYQGNVVGDLSMHFLHEGRPKVTRTAVSRKDEPISFTAPVRDDYTDDLMRVLAHGDVASKEWVIRQYDHEVQGRTVIKPLVGPRHEGPGDAAVILPVRGSTRGLAVACGINPRYGALSAYFMALCVIDEAIRNCVAVGADPQRIALLDNFCWGSPERPETMAELVDAAQACHDAALAYGTPFISGKDSLYNEYIHEGKSTAIPPTLLITAIGQVPDVSKCVTMDLKEPGNALLLVGVTDNELGGSVWAEVNGVAADDSPPTVELELGRATFRAVHEAIGAGLIRSCHDLSEGGLAAGLAEMVIAGGLGIAATLRDGPWTTERVDSDLVDLFSESPSRFLIEVRPGDVAAVEAIFAKHTEWNATGRRLFPQETEKNSRGVPIARIGTVTAGGADARLLIEGLNSQPVIDTTIDQLRGAWLRDPFEVKDSRA